MHVSGHASQEELKLIINLVKPRYFIPIHGEYRQLKLHAELAASMHGSVGNVILIESGDILEFDELGARKAGRVAVGRVCIDSGSRGDVVEDLIIKDRPHLSEFEKGPALALDLEELEHRIATLPCRGVKGTTGTQASFLEIFEGDHAKVRELDRLVTLLPRLTQRGGLSVSAYLRRSVSQSDWLPMTMATLRGRSRAYQPY